MLTSKIKQKAIDLGFDLLYDDVVYIQRQFQRVPYNRRQEVLDEYLDIWRRVMAECESEINGQNLGRKAANEFLRRYNGDACEYSTSDGKHSDAKK